MYYKIIILLAVSVYFHCVHKRFICHNQKGQTHISTCVSTQQYSPHPPPTPWHPQKGSPLHPLEPQGQQFTLRSKQPKVQHVVVHMSAALTQQHNNTTNNNNNNSQETQALGCVVVYWVSPTAREWAEQRVSQVICPTTHLAFPLRVAACRLTKCQVSISSETLKGAVCDDDDDDAGRTKWKPQSTLDARLMPHWTHAKHRDEIIFFWIRIFSESEALLP